MIQQHWDPWLRIPQRASTWTSGVLPHPPRSSKSSTSQEVWARSPDSGAFTVSPGLGISHLHVPKLQSSLGGIHLWDLPPSIPPPASPRLSSLQGRNSRNLQLLYSPHSSSHFLLQPCSFSPPQFCTSCSLVLKDHIPDLLPSPQPSPLLQHPSLLSS